MVHEHQGDSLGREETRDENSMESFSLLMKDSRAVASNDEEMGE